MGFDSINSMRMLLNSKPKKVQAAKGNRFLVSINVLGSAGPIRFVVNEDELVTAVIENALKLYAREGRLPILGSDHKDFFLYCLNAGTEALSPWHTIGSYGARNFMLCRRPQAQKASPDVQVSPRKGSTGSLKAWINKSINLRISSH